MFTKPHPSLCLLYADDADMASTGAHRAQGSLFPTFDRQGRPGPGPSNVQSPRTRTCTCESFRCHFYGRGAQSGCQNRQLRCYAAVTYPR